MILEKKLEKILTISIIVILCILCSCTSKDNKLLDLDFELKEPEKFEFKTEYTEYESNTDTISYSITNVCNEEIGIGTEFELLYKTDVGWKVVAFNKDISFDSIAWILNPAESKVFQLKLEEYYNIPLKTGEYRIARDGYISNVFTVS